MSIIYFDICAIPLFLIILFISFSRKMTKGNANRLFILLVLVSLLSAVADLGIEATSNAVPLSEAGRILCTVSTYAYLALRNANNALLLLFLLALTRTTFLLRRTWARIVFCLPYAGILFLLIQNPFTHNAFTVTAEAGYARAPLMLVFYGIALVYGLGGLVYCIYCRRYLPTAKWGVLLSAYVIVHIVVLIQFFYPELLLEMFCTAVAEMMILFSIMRPEERMDSEVGMLSWTSYQSDIRNIILSGEHVQIIVIRIQNYREIRNYLGDHNYNKSLSEIADRMRAARWNHRRSIELYYERPGSIYLIAESDEHDKEHIGERILSESGSIISRYEERGVRFEPLLCLIRCPDDLQTTEDIISLGHIFPKLNSSNQTSLHAGELVHSRTFTVAAHIKEILNRAVKDGHIELYYQPIYDVHSGGFRSAEALARIIDPEYGLISPAVFIPAAESLGLIVTLGDVVLDQAFRFISEHDLDALGLTYIEINLSVAQCMESSLPEKIRALQQKYNVDPGRVNLEITETTFENISEIMVENVNRLTQMGYTFALDDYGIGYSSIQRINHFPLELIKIDKSVLDDVSTDNGRVILEHTIHMMKDIGKQVVAEGAETIETVELLKNMDCDYIQGYYFSKPVPEEELIRFLEEQNGHKES